jgi:phage terminase small subunit
MTAPLRQRQERFCHEYVTDLDGKAAALRAGYEAGKHLSDTVTRLLRDGRVQARIAALQALIAQRAKDEAAADAEAGWVVLELVKIARADPRKFFHADGTAKKVYELGDDEAAALSGFEPTGEAGKVLDRLKVLELLGRHFGLWPQKAAAPESNLFEGMSLDEIRRIRDKVGRLLGGAGVDLAGSGPSGRAG